MLLSSRDLQGLRHPRHRRQDADPADRRADRPRHRLAAPASSSRRQCASAAMGACPGRSCPQHWRAGLQAAGRGRDRCRAASPRRCCTSPRTTCIPGPASWSPAATIPPDYNGMKMVVAGETLSGEAIQELRTRIETGELATGTGGYSRVDVAQAYYRAHRRRRQAGAAHAHRRRLRQWRGRRVCAASCIAASVAACASCSARSTATSPIIIPIRRSRRTCRT